MRTIAVASQKGGVGKTSFVQNVGYELAAQGQTVVLVDFDPQANLTMSYGIDADGKRTTVLDALEEPERTPETLVPAREGLPLYLMPSSMDLSAAEVNYASDIERQFKLDEALQQLEGHGVDVIMIDAPPSLGFYTVNALVAASEFLIPLQCQGLAWKALDQLFGIIDRIKRKLNSDLDFGGIALTFFDTRNNLSIQVADQAREQFNGSVFEYVVPVNVKIAEAPLRGLTVMEHAPDSRGAQAYRHLAEEVIQRGG